MNNQPTKPKILFIALGESSHTHSWIELDSDKELDKRLFCVDDGKVPTDFNSFSYSLSRNYPFLHPKIKFSFNKKSLLLRGFSLLFKKDIFWLEEKWLARIIRKWKPDIIHTLGLDPASFIYYRIKQKYGLGSNNIWVVTARGGPELALKRLLPDEAPRIKNILTACDQFVADNQQNYSYALELGLEPRKQSSMRVVPGTGGIDIAELSLMNKDLPSKRDRIIVWPKAYECPASKALPVFEALRLCWEKIKPCKIYMTAMIPETRMWFQTLPAEVKDSCLVEDRIARRNLMELLARARVLLAPSLTDGIPNILYESMAIGAFPIVSPLDTIQGIVADERNVLFAENLYPQQIADALIRAMADDNLVDSAARNNVSLVGKIANKEIISRKVVAYYKELVADRARRT